MRVLVFILVAVMGLNTAPAFAAIAEIGALLSCNETTDDTALECTTSAQLDANNVGVFIFASDNQCNGSGTETFTNQNEHTTATIDGNSMTKLFEVCSDIDGGVDNGVTCSAWTYRAVANIASSAAVVFNLANSKASKVALGREFSVSAGNSLAIAGSDEEAYDSAVVGSLALSSLASKEYLFLRGLCRESESGTQITPTTNYTNWGIATANTGVSATSIQARGEHRVLTGTGDTSAPTTGSGDWVTFYIALQETGRRSIAPIILP